MEDRPGFKIYKYSFILKNQIYTSLMLTKYNKYASDSHRFLKRNARRLRLVSTFCCQTLSLGCHLINVADHVEGNLGKVIVLAGQDGLEARDGLVNGDKFAGVVGENLSDLERLGEESLDLPGPGHLDLVLLGQLVHTEDSNDILERLVVLEQLLDTSGDLVVLTTDDVGVHDTAGRVEGIHSRGDTSLSNRSGQHSGGVQVSEGGGWGRVSQVVSRHVDGLDRGNGALRGGDSLLHATHVSGQGWLVAHSRRNTTQQSGHFGTGLSESEDVVNEEQHILTLLVTEVLGHGQSSQSHTGTGAGGLVHLTVDQGDLGGLVLQADDASLNHLVVQVVTLTGSLSHTSEHGVTTVGLGNVVDQFHDQDSLADTGSTKQTNLASLGIGSQQINHLDTSYQDLLLDTHLVKLGSLGVDGLALLGVDGAPLVNGLTDHVDDPSKGLGADRDHDGVSGVIDNLVTDETLGTVHGNGSDGVLSKVLGDLQDELGGPVLNLESVEDLRESIFKLDVNHGTDDRDNLALGESRDGRAHGEISPLCNGCCGENVRDISSFDSLFHQASCGTTCCSQHLYCPM